MAEAPLEAHATAPVRPGLAWVWHMAWKDARRYRARLVLFLMAIALGVAALVSIQSLSASFRGAVAAESKTLLGADLVLSASGPLPDSLQSVIDSIPGQQLGGVAFNSMAQFYSTGGARLAEVRGVEQGFPYYGQFETQPPGVADSLWVGPYALVEEALLVQFGANPGDSVRIGEKTFAIAAALLTYPGSGSGFGFGSPRIYIDARYLPETRLIRFGSRVRYFTYFNTSSAPTFDPEQWERDHRFFLDEARITATTVQDRQEGLGRVFENLFRFFNLIAFIALLLGGVGVASSVQVYLRERRSTMALLRCLGASGGTTTRVYLVQLLQVALVGTGFGIALGIGLQLAWPYLLKGLLPVPVTFVIDWQAVLLGAGVGLGLSLLFALIPLVRTRRISPLVVLRASADSPSGPTDRLPWLLYLLIAFAVVSFATAQLGSWLSGVVYSAALAFAALALRTLAVLLRAGLRRLVRPGMGFVLRQGLSGLYRPRNQTLVLLVTLGLGTFLLGTLYFVQENLQQQTQVNIEAPTRPNLILFDIQTDQRHGVDSLLVAEGIERQELTPVVTVRMETVRGQSFAELRADSTLNVPWWAGEYRVSYRDTLMPSESIVSGTWQGRHDAAVTDTVPLSVGTQLREVYRFQLGDVVTFNVQGVRLVAKVTSFREIDFLSGNSSFQLLFPAGVLEEAPQFWVATAKATGAVASARMQRKLVQVYPNVSVVDLAATLDNAQRLLGQITLIIQFLASFSLATGLLVLVGALLNSQAQRLRENVLLRTLGAQTRQLFGILAVEYLLIGALAAASGLLLAVGAAWALTTVVFQASFDPAWHILPLGVLMVALLTGAVGLVGSYQLVGRSPLAVLRETLEQ